MHLVQAAVIDGRGGGDVPNVQQHIGWINEAITNFRSTKQVLGSEQSPWKPRQVTQEQSSRVATPLHMLRVVSRRIATPTVTFRQVGRRGAGSTRGGC